MTFDEFVELLSTLKAAERGRGNENLRSLIGKK